MSKPNNVSFGLLKRLYFFLVAMILLKPSDEKSNGCLVDGKFYKVGEKFINAKCTAKCTCDGINQSSCIDLCPLSITKCNRNEHLVTYKTQVSPKCFCNRQRCVRFQ